MKKYERGDLPKTDWLDKLVFRRMEEIHAVRMSINYLFLIVKGTCGQAEAKISENMFLYIDLPRFDFPVVFDEPVCII